MAFLFSKKPLSPEKVPTDDVIPVHYFDDSEIFRSLVVEFALRFDDVLDHEKLYNALVRLMEIGNWRKLGARLRLNVLSLLLSLLNCPSQLLWCIAWPTLMTAGQKQTRIPYSGCL